MSEQSGLFIAQIVKELFELVVIHLLGGRFPGTIGRGHVHLNQFGALLLRLLAIFVFGATGSDLDVVINDREFAALVLEGFRYRIKLSLSLGHLLINLGDIRFDFFQGALRVFIQRLILRVLLTSASVLPACCLMLFRYFV